MQQHGTNVGDEPDPPARLSYGIDEAARALGLGRTTIYALIGEGLLRSIKVGNRRLIPASALESFLAAALEGVPT